MADITENLYAERKIMAMGNYYMRHVDRMTREGLHAKSDIAAELGFRDMEIDRLRARVAELEAAKGEPVAWRGINELGEVVTEWIDGTKPARLFDLCGNESGYASYQIAYTAPPAPTVDVDAISDEAIKRGWMSWTGGLVIPKQTTSMYAERMRAALRAIFNKGE